MVIGNISTAKQNSRERSLNMKNIKFFLLSLIAVTLLFSACSDLSKDTSGNQKKSQYTVLGSLSFAGVSRAVYSRTATTAFSDEPVWTISATKGEKSYLPNEVSDLAFNFTFDEAGEYLIEATALKAGKIIAQGSNSCTVSKEGENLANIIAKPVASTLPGSVNLEINLDSYSANKVSSVQVEWLGFVNIDRTKQALGYPSGAELTGDEKEPVISEEVQTAIAALIDWEEQRSEGEFNTNLPVESGKAVIEMDNIFCGAHTVKLSFSDSVGNTLYSCKEILNVYSGFTTNEWYGSAPYLNNGTFTLTENLVEKYGTDLVPSTQYMLYNMGADNYEYYLVDGFSPEIPSTATAANDSTSRNSLCFDSDGYYYILTKEGEDHICVTSNKPGFGSETASANNGAMKIRIDLGNVISVDRATNYLYAFDKSYRQITRITKEDGSYNYDPDDSCYTSTKSYSVDSTAEYAGIINNSTRFTVYNNIAYFASIVDDKIAIINLNNTGTEMDVEVNVAKTVSLGLSGMGLSSEATCSDMLYQDGAVYMLVRDSKAETNEIYSQGGIIKYDVILGTISQVGFVPGTNLSSFIAATKTDQYPLLYKSEDATDYYLTEFTLAEGNYYRIYAPYNSQESFFVGPQKFIAIKPKKLVISDTGLAFYTTENGVLAKKKINRVVEIDLETLSMENVKMTDVAVEFNAEYPVPSMSGINVTKQLYSGNAYREFEGSFYEVTGSITLKPVIIEE